MSDFGRDYAEIQRRIGGFAEDMRRANIHVGVGAGGFPAICACCGQPWPCESSGGTHDND